MSGLIYYEYKDTIPEKQRATLAVFFAAALVEKISTSESQKFELSSSLDNIRFEEQAHEIRLIGINLSIVESINIRGTKRTQKNPDNADPLQHALRVLVLARSAGNRRLSDRSKMLSRQVVNTAIIRDAKQFVDRHIDCRVVNGRRCCQYVSRHVIIFSLVV